MDNPLTVTEVFNDGVLGSSESWCIKRTLVEKID